ncbi:MAG TPA: acetolactate synthase small subunit [Hungateiclostridium thermocellum]|jgi:acetolactate synthase-1/3 small subunit|uniref:Acetolactate synthase small subunit n=2 Tax=Acetivibrio thermocellus TaxID=1515 RepID=A3DIE0_ACET2|nr:acetolactate synthase small subunit [Acetivibrio thermocellus]CDG36992.1 acetolactate synthase, small subunit [Acetivibrio thermocellus BC1]ABN53719.1 acetolactate synthase, small subunit [Acetivibrio thermocellus ATCC 27405]ADU73197.1 acetolactate synthase, small subunit [Acetivibrio thermocellus DSM 1313]ALX07112.1 acetolactate synthase, small subunit [Acetivibrio thermocellus AD2]ANV74848.1 acetolactate synthase, small subunit [Acetivibrio thermocellus DSM 2360]
MAKHTLSVLVENHAGVLSRIAGLFSRRGFNIDSLAVGVTENPEISRMTIVVDGDDYIVEQVTKQLNKLVDVIKIKELDESDSVSRELALIKVGANASTRSEIVQIAEIFRAKIVDVSKTTLTIEISGSVDKVAALEDMLKQFGIKEIVRTGTIAIERGNKVIKNKNSDEE